MKRSTLGISIGTIEQDAEKKSIVVSPTEDPLKSATVVQIRQAFEMTQPEFAEFIGTTLRTVKAWERARRDADARNCTGPARKFILHLLKEKQDGTV